MQLFYDNSINSDLESFIFSKEESKHIIKVLRKQENDLLYVTNGIGELFTTQITFPSDSKCIVKILSFKKEENNFPKLHLAVAPTKMNERFEWFLEKATEIGIAEITPIICDNSERKIIKNDRFEKVILSAMKQSNQFFLPKLNEAIKFSDFVSKKNETQKFIAHCEENEKKSLKSALKINTDAIILIGPEGDFSEKEINLALKNNYFAISLGNNRLRTETAAIVACHSFNFCNEK
jgi:16S rRNA (uracil1498-N3)-methyltransferase